MQSISVVKLLLLLHVRLQRLKIWILGCPMRELLVTTVEQLRLVPDYISFGSFKIFEILLIRVARSFSALNALWALYIRHNPRV